MYNFTHPTEAPPRSYFWIPRIPGFLQPFAGAILLVSLLYLKKAVDWSPILTPLGKVLRTLWRLIAKAFERSEESKQNAIFRSYENIKPLSDFNWKATEPIQLRPFKPLFHMTMGLENTTLSDLYLFDNTYKDRVKLRRDLISEQTTNVVDLTYRALGPIQEFYSWMVCNYLPKRYPTIFSLGMNHAQEAVLHNAVLNEDIPLSAPNAFQALMILNAHVDTDFFFLLPEDEKPSAPDSQKPGEDSTPKPQPKYILEGFLNAFPSGFHTPSKLGLNLAGIHRPVPGFPQKLEKSMDRYFSTLPLGKAVKRVNWTVTTDPTLYQPGGTHMDSSEEAEPSGQELLRRRQEAEHRIQNGQAILRCERQTLHRLPGSKAIVFSFKTYAYPLEAVWSEGSGEKMAEAIEGIGKGSVPRMMWYKSAVVWGDATCRYLRRPLPAPPKEKQERRKKKDRRTSDERMERKLRKEIQKEKAHLEQARREQEEAGRKWQMEMHWQQQWEEGRRRESEYRQWQAEEEQRRQWQAEEDQRRHWEMTRAQDWQRGQAYEYPPMGSYALYPQR